MKEPGQIFIVSAPSGSGKTTLVKGLLETSGDLAFSVSHTTRRPRATERDGLDYFFVSETIFKAMIERGEFLEHARVFGDYYGTSRRHVEECIAGGQDLLLDIDTKGAAQVRQKLPGAVSIFILPPSYQVLRQRLENRRLDSAQTIRRRLAWALREEIHQFRDYDYVVVNDQLQRCSQQLRSIIQAERCRPSRSLRAIEPILKSFGGQSLDE